MDPPGCALPLSHHEMTTNNQTIPDRSPPGSTRTAPIAVHQDGGVKYATGTPSKIRGKKQHHHWNTKTLSAAGKFQELTHEIGRYRWNNSGLCEMRWKNSKKKKKKSTGDFYGVVPKGLFTLFGSLHKEVAKTTSGTLMYFFERQTARQKKKKIFHRKTLCPRLRV